ncbi:MAG: LytTR family DNA-binding domain-containing protein, partial [Pseudomonadota bacterium]|nr:LytTR family DNA-binding domain-containing protein [Pseudomonadota bacterium]
MNSLKVALREWRRQVSSPRLWAVWALTSGLFAVAAPFGLGQGYGPADRLVYWLIALGASWAVLTVFEAISWVSMRNQGVSPLSTLTVSVTLSAPLVALILGGLRAQTLDMSYGFGAWFASLPGYAALTLLLAAKSRVVTGRPLGIGVLDRARPLGAPTDSPREAPAPARIVVPDATESHAAPPPVPETVTETSPPPAPAKRAAPDARAKPPPAPPEPAPAPTARDLAAGPRLLQRLSPARRAPLLRLTMNDHYVSVATEAGDELLLMRLGDAMDEAWPEEGLRVHRSHWVARRAVAEVKRDGDRALLRLTNGEEIPVSRARMRELRAAGWLKRSARASVSAPGAGPQPVDAQAVSGHRQAAAMDNPPARVSGPAGD